MNEVTKELIDKVLDAVIEVVGRHTSMTGRLGLKVLAGFLHKMVDDGFTPDVKAALSASAPAGASAPPELRQVALAALNALAGRVAHLPALPALVEALKEAVEGPMFDAVYDYLIEKGLAAAKPTVSLDGIKLTQIDLRAAGDRVHNACAEATKDLSV